MVEAVVATWEEMAEGWLKERAEGGFCLIIVRSKVNIL